MPLRGGGGGGRTPNGKCHLKFPFWFSGYLPYKKPFLQVNQDILWQRGLSQGTHSARLKVKRGVNSPDDLHDGFLSTDEGGLRRHLHTGHTYRSQIWGSRFLAVTVMMVWVLVYGSYIQVPNLGVRCHQLFKCISTPLHGKCHLKFPFCFCKLSMPSLHCPYIAFRLHKNNLICSTFLDTSRRKKHQTISFQHWTLWLLLIRQKNFYKCY